MESINIYVGAMIETLRKESGYSQQSLAGMLSLTRTSVVNIEKGRQSVSVDKLLKICAIFECDPTDILPKVPKIKISHEVKKVVHTYKTPKADFNFSKLNNKGGNK